MSHESLVTLKVDGNSSSDLLIRAANGDVVAFDGLPDPDYYHARLSKTLHRGVYVVEVAAHWRHHGFRGHSLEFRGEGIVAPYTHRLDGLAITDVNLAAFSTNVRNYTRYVAADVAAVTVTPTVAASDTVVRISPADSDPSAEGHQVALEADGSTDIAVSVAHPLLADLADTYSVALTQLAGSTGPLSDDASLSALSLSGIDIGDFNPATAAYTARISNSTAAATTVTATPADQYAKVINITPADADPATADGHQISLAEWRANTITVVVDSAAGTTQQTYTVDSRPGLVLTPFRRHSAPEILACRRHTPERDMVRRHHHVGGQPGLCQCQSL